MFKTISTNQFKTETKTLCLVPCALCLASINFIFRKTLKKLFRFSILIIFVSLFLSTSTIAATYYVDATNGNDKDNGLAQETAWKTIAKLDNFKFSPGDMILLRRGEVWRDTINLISSGTPSSSITIDSYGNGPKPLILGSQSKTGIAYWKLETHNLWYVEGIKKNPEMVFHNGVGSQRRPKKESLKQMWDWWYDSIRHRVYYYLYENPGVYNIEIPVRNGVGFNSQDHIVIRNIEIAYAYYGIGLWGGNRWLIDNVYIHDITRCAIQGNKASKSIVIQNSTIQDWNWRGYRASQSDGDSFKGYGIQILSSKEGEPSDNWIITNNILRIENMQSGADTCAINIDQQGHAAKISKNKIIGKNTGSGIMYWRPKGNSSTVTIAENSIINVAHMGINISEFDVNNFTADIIIERNVISNTCARDVHDQEALRIWTNNKASVIIRSNLINSTIPGINDHHGIRIRQSTDVRVFNNTIFGTDIGIAIERHSTSIILKNNISSGNRVAAINVDAASSLTENHNNFFGEIFGISPSPATIIADPKFVDPFSGNFNLQPDSPSIDAGTSLNEEFYDLNGILRSKGAKANIGAFQFEHNKLIIEPKNLKIVIN